MNTRPFPLPLLAALALASPSWVGAQTVYRCGNAYQAQPCPGARPVDVSDPRSPAEVEAARARLTAEQRANLKMSAEHRAREAEWRAQRAAEARRNAATPGHPPRKAEGKKRPRVSPPVVARRPPAHPQPLMPSLSAAGTSP